MRTRKNVSGTCMMIGGLVLLAAALFLTAYNLWDDRRAGNAVEAVLDDLQREVPLAGTEEDVPDYLLTPEMEMPTVMIDGNAYVGTLQIPSLGLSLPVMSEWSYPGLRIAPCRYTGSAYIGNLVIAAHNYKQHFGEIDSLAAGERILFTDAAGNEFSYEVAETQVLEPEEVEEMVDDTWDLSLFTCTISGKVRVTVRCVKTDADDKAAPVKLR